MKRTYLLALQTVLLLFLVQPSWAVSINEIRIDQFGAGDPDEYFELHGSPGESLDGLTYLVIGDSPAGFSGVIEAVVNLDKRMIADDGFFLATESSFGAPGTAFQDVETEMTTILEFENNDNLTHLLVTGFTGLAFDDLDVDDDGMLEVTPWSSVVDAVGLVRLPAPSPPDSEWYYGVALGGVDIGPDGIFVPGHVYRETDGSGAFTIGEFSLDTSDPEITIDDTPGGPNMPGNPGVDGDFDDNGMYECADVDSLVAEIAGGTDNPDFDMTGDGLVDDADLTDWLAEAGSIGQLTQSGNPVLVGDANLDGSVDGGDFLDWNDHKFTATAAWCDGDFNADGQTDGADFLLWNDNKFQTADAASVPEPTGLLCLVLGWLILSGRCRS